MESSELAENQVTKEVIGFVLIFLTIILYVPAIVLIYLRKKSQPIRHRSPYLLLISLLSSFLLQISLSTIIFLDPNENNTRSFSCHFYIFNTNIMHFIIIFSYIFRSLRLMNVFNLKDINSNFQKNRMREEYFLKWILFIFLFLVVIFTITLFSNKLENIFKIELPLCRTNSQLDEMHISFKLTWLIIHTLEIILIFYSIVKLRSIKDEFKISFELLIVGIIWLTSETLLLVDAIFLKKIDFKIVLIIEILRNFLLVLFSGLIPLMKSFESLHLPVCITKECAANFNLALITEKSYDCFYSYLTRYMPEGAKFLTLWTELNVFKHSSNKNELKFFSTDIYQKYLNENSEFYIDFPEEVIKDLNSSFINLSKNSYNPVFDNMAEYAYSTLRDVYFPNFKCSEEFRRLERELENDEIIYSRLVASSMISSMEIE